MDMNICFIGKYPPIQGGVSRDNFWMSYILADKGFDVHVVTNAQEVEYPYRVLEETWDENLPNPIESLKRRVKIHYSSYKAEYIPWANPFVTKLASIATNVIQEYKCNILFSFYLEPYALAAYLASHWTGVPYGIQHAGSDVGRLFLSEDLETAYTKVIQASDYILTSNRTLRSFAHLGVELEKLYPIVPFSLPTSYFNPFVPPLDINKFLRAITKVFPKSNYAGIFHQFANKLFDPSLPTIGIYGKTSRTKGSFDLIQALNKLKSEGLKFNFLALTQGTVSTVTEFAKMIKDSSLGDATWLLPFIPHWYIPNFIRSCTAVCSLERDFPIKQLHHPIIPKEVFACGTCLVLSHEIANKQSYRNRLINGSNVFIVEPQNIEELASTLRIIIENPALSQEVGMKGYKQIASTFLDFDAYANRLVSSFTEIWQDVNFRRNKMSIAEMQACLARLYTDDPFRKLFYIDPDNTLAEYKLTEHEINAIKGIDQKLLNHFAFSLKNKAKKRFVSAYPLLFKVNPTEISRYYDRYYQLYPATPHELESERIITFGKFIAQTLATDDDLPPYSKDLAEYERLYYIARYAPSVNDSFKQSYTEHKPSVILTLDTLLTVKRNVQIGTFEYDIVKIVNDLQQSQSPIDLQVGEYHYVFQQSANSFTPRVFSISLATKQLLELCDGDNLVSDLIVKMAKLLNMNDFEKSLVAILNELIELKVIGVVSNENAKR